MPIRKLPENLANKIAAGEVVERPASVVKELIENSLDADATEITVEVEDSGKRLIAVHDNGYGIPPEELHLAIERHATSKLKTDEDLFAIDTLGFRGEALPSIAAVSRFKLVSRTADNDFGAFIEVEGGKVIKEGPVGAPVGTSVYVKDLFFNVPARLKFLKKPATEFAHIVDVFTRIFLVRPNVRATLLHNGTTIFSLRATENHLERTAELLGEEVFRLLFPFEERQGDYKVNGFAGAPASVRRTSTSAFYFYVNSRPVRDKILHQAVLSAYGTLVEKGTYPLVVLNLTLPPNEVDVNVHPTKAEVRFRHRNEVFYIVRRAISKLLDEVPWLKDVSVEPENNAHQVLSATLEDAPQKAQHFLSQPSNSYNDTKQVNKPVLSANRVELSKLVSVHTQSKSLTELPQQQSTQIESNTKIAHPILPEGKYSALIPIGVISNTYIVCESENGMVLIDQHAAHERIMYVKIKQQLNRQGLRKSRTMFPFVVKVGEHLAAVAEGFKDELETLGFEIEPLSGGDVAVKAMPELLEHRSSPEELVKAMLAELAEHGNPNSAEEAIDLVIATTACHSAVRAGEVLTKEEIAELLHQLDETERSGYCPHGRPVAVEISITEIERRFGRRK